MGLSIRFMYRQMFAFFFMLCFAIIVVSSSFRGRNVFDEISTVLLVSFGFGILGLIVNLLLNMIFSQKDDIATV